MKQNIIIILFTAAVVLLLVNLLLGRVPPTAFGAKAATKVVMCPNHTCVVIDGDGVAYMVGMEVSRKLGHITAFPGPSFEQLKRDFAR